MILPTQCFFEYLVDIRIASVSQLQPLSILKNTDHGFDIRHCQRYTIKTKDVFSLSIFMTVKNRSR